MKYRCPECGGDNIEMTCMGYIRGKNMNRTKCYECKWVGKAWECEEPNSSLAWFMKHSPVERAVMIAKYYGVLEDARHD